MALGNGNGATSAVNGDIKNTTVNEKTLINNTGTTAEVEQAYKTSRQVINTRFPNKFIAFIILNVYSYILITF